MSAYVGRFAPSPTGPLHFGSLVAALASWLDARAAGGRWLVRIEDLDGPRQHPGAADGILRTLEALGLEWDGPVVLQSRRQELYGVALGQLEAHGHTYPCACSRKEIADSALGLDGARIYPGTCRGGLAPRRRARSVRLRTSDAPIRFRDRAQGEIEQSVAREVGDFVLCRTDGLYAYQLAVVVDDAEQGVTDVVRGADLLDSTARQIVLQRLLGLALPRYLHVPVALNAGGEKLSKQTGARPVDMSRGGEALRRALVFLGQAETDYLVEAIRDWNPARIPACRALKAKRAAASPSCREAPSN